MFILWLSKCLPNFMKSRDCLFKILKTQNVADGQTDGRPDNVKTVYPDQHCLRGGGGIKIFHSHNVKLAFC